MAQTAAQICAMACAIAKVPGMTSQAGQLLNVILSELAQTYDFDLNKKTLVFNFNPSLISPISGSNSIYGSGPYPLPADYLRAVIDDVFWTNQGVPYPLIPIDLADFDMAVQQAGIQSYPYWFCTDMSTAAAGSLGYPTAYVYAPPSGAYPCTVRYYSQPSDIATPETSATVPWFPLQSYLITRLAGELMKLADDTRYQSFLGDGPEGAQGILSRYLPMKDDRTNRVGYVRLDPRRFGRPINNLPNTKTVGW